MCDLCKFFTLLLNSHHSLHDGGVVLDTWRLRNSPRVTQQRGARILTWGAKFQSLHSSLSQLEFPSPTFPSPSGTSHSLTFSFKPGNCKAIPPWNSFFYSLSFLTLCCTCSSFLRAISPSVPVRQEIPGERFNKGTYPCGRGSLVVSQFLFFSQIRIYLGLWQLRLRADLVSFAAKMPSCGR